ncbi:response regulator [Aestuariivirga sp.]|uniref:response regulator n=1 Tax=Aestuariivirga sp. TaxID=2650926 RepID=UPI003BAB77A8
MRSFDDPQQFGHFSVRSFGLDPSVAMALGAALFALLISGAISWVNQQAMRDRVDSVTATHAVIVTLGQMLSDIQDAETGQRGYLLTGDEKYLAPYDAALKSIPARANEIALLVNDDGGQSARLQALRRHLDAKLSELRESINVRRTQGLQPALTIVRSGSGKAEMDAIRENLSNLVAEEMQIRTQRFSEMDAALRLAVISGLVSGLLGLGLTFMIGLLVRRSTLARQRQDWLQTGQVGIAGAMMGEQLVDQLGTSLLEFLARYVRAVAGAVYVGNGQEFRLVSLYGVPDEAKVRQRFGLRDGLLGQAAAENRSLLISEVPDDYIRFGSSLGHSQPRQLAILPISADGLVNAVIELGFIRPVNEKVLALLQQASSAMAAGVRSAVYREQLASLLQETQRQAEELQAQSEELRVSNEELEEQGRALKESQARLEQQQVELEQTNSQLEEQMQKLESQRDDLEKATAANEAKASELEQANRYKSDFLANMSHELRTPLNSSLILAKLLADNSDENLTEEQVKYARTIESSGNDLLRLINDILDLSKIEAGHVAIRPEPVSVERIVGSLQHLFQPVAAERRLVFTLDIQGGLPLLETDPQRLEQVLKNLLSNAFKFTEVGEVKLAVQQGKAGQFSFAVSDTGIGISADQQNRVFEAFHQADGTISRRYGGTGLGLSISRRLVELLGGNIELTSAEGKGSTFTVNLPPIFDSVRAEEQSQPASRAEGATSSFASSAKHVPPVHEREVAAVEDDRNQLGGGKRVLLIVEDDRNFASILRDLARDMDFQSLVAGTADEALTLAREFMPQAIILDIGLPDHSGLSVLERLKRDTSTRHIPVHAVSAEDHVETALSLGAVGYEMKPVSHAQLVEVVRKFEARLARCVRRILIVEDDPVQREAVAKLLTSHDVETVSVGTAAECLKLLKEQVFDCVVLDLSLPDATGYSLLEALGSEADCAFPPVIVYTGRDLSQDEERRLRRYSRSIIIKGAKSPERLLDEVSLFLHQVVAKLPEAQQKMIRKALNREAILEGRRILVVEDDIRNVYALTNILEPRGASVEIARNGRAALDALETLQQNSDTAVDLVLMDVMMPVMDGLTAIREIRKNPDWKKLPVITLTAKAMPDDQRRCIEAGASDYIAKPLDVDKLLSLVRVWMPK